MEETKEKYSYQICQDEKTIQEFSNLHHDIVNMVIKFCKDHELEVDEFYISADGLYGSLPFGSWQCFSDSSFSLYNFDFKKKKEERKPVLWSI